MKLSADSLEVLATGPQACATFAYAAVYFGVLPPVINPLGREVQAGYAIGVTGALVGALVACAYWLLGAGRTRTILWVSAPLNGLRVPLGWLVAVHLGLGAPGMWWVLNATSAAKAAAYAWVVQRGRWARAGLHHA